VEYQYKAARAVNGHVIELGYHKDLRETLVSYADFHAKDLHHWSQHGHDWIASKVRSILEKVGAKREDEVSKWDQRFPLAHSPTLVLKSFHGKVIKEDTRPKINEKYAMEMLDHHGWIEVHNPADKPSSVYVQYMTTGPPPAKYPKARFRLKNPLTNADGVLVDPIAPDYYTHPVHINKLVHAGTISPGNSTLFVNLQERDKPWNFRITAIVVTNEEDSKERTAQQ